MTERRPTPSRITVALDMAGLFGPEADRRLGVLEPTVDLWEAGTLVPTGEQIALLADLAGVLPEWLYGEPITPAVVMVCHRTRKAAGGGPRCQAAVYPELPEPEQGRLF